MDWLKNKIKKITWEKTKDQLYEFILTIIICVPLGYLCGYSGILNGPLKPLLPIGVVAIFKGVEYCIKQRRRKIQEKAP